MAEHRSTAGRNRGQRAAIALAAVGIVASGVIAPSAAGAADPSADLSVSVSHTPDTATAPAELTFTISAHNDGPDTAENVVAGLGFQYPLQLRVPPEGCRRAASYESILCELGDVASGATAEIDIVLEARGSGLYTLPVAVASDTPDPDAADRVVNDTVLVKAGPSQSVRYIRGIFPMIMQRTPNTATVDYWAARWKAENNRWPRNLQNVPAGIINSNEYRRLRIREAYLRILGRPADAPSLDSWVSKAAGGMAYETIERRLLTSKEFENKAGSDLQRIANAYQTVLGRQPSTTESAAAFNARSKQTFAALVLSLQRSTEGYDVNIDQRYQAPLGHAPSALGRYVWQARLRQGRTAESLWADLLVSGEVLADYPYTEDDYNEGGFEYDVPVSQVQAALGAG